MRGVVAFVVMVLLGGSALADEIRENYDPGGKLVRRVTIKENTIVQQVTLEYDSSGRSLRRTTVADGKTSLETWAYLPNGKVSANESWSDGKLISRIRYLYIKGRLASVTTEADAQESVTVRYSYDVYGNVALTETLNAAGEVVSRTLAERPRPLVPIGIALGIGLDFESDTRIQQVASHFEVTRKPTLELFGHDPLEVRAAGSWQRAVVDDDVVTDSLSAFFGIDYNFLLPRTTLFLFMNFERNPVTNLSGDLSLAPLGVKLDLVPRDPWLLDLSLAPVWNLRTITAVSSVEEPEDCADTLITIDDGGQTRYECEDETSTTKLRASFRSRAAFNSARFSISNVLEYLPHFGTAGKSFGWALRNDAIVRDAVRLKVKLSRHLSLTQELRYTWDPTLSEQAADCSSSASSSLCRDFVLSTSTSLAVQFDILR